MKSAIAVFCSIMILTCVIANAEIEKTGVPCKQGLCLLYWPKLAPVQGWHHDTEQSTAYAINAQAPDGYTFGNAETVIYARAIHKPGIPETKSLDMFIQNDKKEFLDKDPNTLIAEVEPLKTGDGQSLKAFTFYPKKTGNWEQVAYGEEGDYYLIFSISSKTKEGLTKNLGSYRQFIQRFKEKP